MQPQQDDGFTVIELMCVLALIAVLSATAIYDLKSIGSPLANGTYTLENFLHLARSRAISGTHIVEVKALSANRLIASSSDSCTGTMTAIGALTLELPTGANLSNTTTKVCFTQRGLTDATATFALMDTEGNHKSVKVALGGGTKIE